MQIMHFICLLAFQNKFNIFLVNWVSDQDVGTVDEKKIDLTYRRPYQNTRIVGRHLGMFIKKLHDLFGVTYDSMHLIGHNMGAHVAGYAGKYLRDNLEPKNQAKLGQITGECFSCSYR